jgi:hypothetical protein
MTHVEYSETQWRNANYADKYSETQWRNAYYADKRICTNPSIRCTNPFTPQSVVLIRLLPKSVVLIRLLPKSVVLIRQSVILIRQPIILTNKDKTMNTIRTAITALFKLSLLFAIVMMSGIEAKAGEYIITLESLTVFKADEFTRNWWDSENEMHRGYCNSQFVLKITQRGKTLFEETLACNKKWLSATQPAVISINKEVTVDATTNSKIWVEIYEDDYYTDDTLSSTSNECLSDGKKICRIDLSSHQGKLALKFAGKEDYDNQNTPIEVELKLHIKPKTLELQQKFINQVKTYIPQQKQVGFVKKYVRPHTYSENIKIIFSRSRQPIIKGTTTKPALVYTLKDHKIVPPYLTWTNEWANSKKGRVYFRFANGERIQIQKDTSIALPILKWLNAKKGDGLLIFATNQVKRLFRLSELVKYNQSEDVKLQ